MPKYQAIRGTKDILPSDAAKFQCLETAARKLFKKFGYEEIRTPTFESVDLFQRSLGETTDVVQKEMYVFEDRGGRKLALRPEGTAGVVRAFIEHHLSQNAPFCKLFYIGQMFRAERPQAGRYREFWQIGAEYFMNASPAADAELLELVEKLFLSLNIGEVRLKINSLGDSACRPKYLDALRAYLKKKRGELCDDCKERAEKNPLRALDCKVDGEKLVDAPTIDTYWCSPCSEHFNTVRALLDAAKVSYVLTPRLVRGLDYYSRTVFEVTSSALGAQDALAAGGRYDKLVKDLDGPDVPAIGFAMGMERAIQAMTAETAKGGDGKKAETANRGAKVFIAAMGEDAAKAAFVLMSELRQHKSLEQKNITFEGGFFEKKLGAQLTIADRIGAEHAIILGEDEVKQGKVTFKTFKASSQKTIEKSQLITHLMNLDAQTPLD